MWSNGSIDTTILCTYFINIYHILSNVSIDTTILCILCVCIYFINTAFLLSVFLYEYSLLLVSPPRNVFQVVWHGKTRFVY